MAESISLKLTGAPIAHPSLPSALRSALRGVDGARADEFIPDGYLKISAAFEVGRRARSTAEGVVEKTVPAADNEIVVLEMADGVTVITSAIKLRETLRRVKPDAVQADGTISLDALHERGAAARGLIGDAASDLVVRVFTLTAGAIADPIIDAAKRKALEWLGEKRDDKIQDYAELGVTWLGTKALMWAIENRLDHKPGLYRWPRGSGQAADLLNVDANELAEDAKEGPLLVFIHGTASSTTGSFGALQKVSTDDWQALESRFADRIFAFEHHNLSESPIQNAIELATALPARAELDLVTHSRGGLVGDLLCLENISDDLIDGYKSDLAGPGDVADDERERIKSELANAHAEQRDLLRELRALLQQKQFVIRRYVRVAAPSRGTLLASGNFDIFLSALLTLIGRVPYLYGDPLYYAFKRVVIEIAKNRTDPKLVPGIEAMLPDSPMARFLAMAQPQPSVRLAVIAGDIEGGGLLKRLGVIFTDYAFFRGVDNDFVVDTGSMYAGIARRAGGRALLDQGPATSHFNYFQNDATRGALRDWLMADDVAQLETFRALPGDLREPSLAEEKTFLEARRSRADGAAEASFAVAVVLPGIMGSHLWQNQKDRLWFEFAGLVAGGLDKLHWTAATATPAGDGITAEKLFDLSYGDLCLYLMDTHRVERFPYDWRLPLNLLAESLEKFLLKLVAETRNPVRPIRLLAHSMGGLVVRALIHKNPQLWDEIMGRDGARFVMLGTPNQGAHSMVEALLGKSDTLRSLARIDLQHDLQAILDIIGEFRGALQLLPKAGFHDEGAAQFDDYFTAARWLALKEEMKDFWFGDKVAALPSEAALNEGRWLWDRDGELTPALPERHKDKTIYVHGCSPNTACGVKKIDGRWKMIGTIEGDGTVTWKSGAINGIGRRYYMPALHGDLAATYDYFAGLTELLRTGATGQLSETPPAARDAEEAKPRAYDAGPPRYAMPDEAAYALMGAAKRKRLQSRPVSTLKVVVKAMDLRFVSQPIMVGHYEQDAISGAEALIDSELVDHALSERYNLGLYAGSVGTSVVVFRLPNEAERVRGSARGAVVTGLGTYDGTLSPNTLTEAVRAGALRYLLQYVDSSGESSGEIGLCSLLLGYNSTANLTIPASVEALVRGVVEANQKFAEATRRSLRIGSLEIVELYLDTAISAMRFLREFAHKSNTEANSLGVRLDVPEELAQDRGARQRLDDSRAVGYWPRMMITDADRNDDERAVVLAQVPAARDFSGQPSDGKNAEADSDTVVNQPPSLRLPLAPGKRIRFVHVGQRARAETIVQQRQLGLLETLIAQQIQEKSYRPDFRRTLFQLMVPHDFKDAARQLDRIVLVLDGYTANLPWELMLADAMPLAVHSPMIRQLSSTQFRRRVRGSLEPLAYVIGNPSTEKFFKNFPVPGRKPDESLISLDGAEHEAEAVVEALRRYGYSVEQSIGAGYSALQVINPLYQKPYRIVHIAAHGAFALTAADGTARSGVVLSDGLLLSAAEIDQMEIVPDLVFLNCCHLGKMDVGPVAYNRLAYSISRELIEIGVRCVIAAGWAVDDDAAATFAETFYQKLLHDKLEFGEAVFEARRETYRKHGHSLTWGAYQAYGDPGWRIDPRDGGSNRGSYQPKFVTPEELIDQIERVGMGIFQRRETMNKSVARNVAAQLQQLLSRSPKHWLENPAVNFALAGVYAELGVDYFERARALYSAAVSAGDRKARVPIVAIEQLANIEARLGEHQGSAELVDRAIERLNDLVKITADKEKNASTDGASSRSLNAERMSMVGSAYKRKAAVFARQILAEKNQEEAGKNFAEAIENSIDAYRLAAGEPKEARFDVYPALNWLALRALDGPYQDGEGICRLCAAKANERFLSAPNIWSAVMAAESYLIEVLCTGALGQAGADGERILAQVVKRYAESLTNVQFAPKDLDSITQQLDLLALFFDAKSRTDGPAAQGQKTVALRLRQIAESIRRADATTQGSSKPGK